MTNVSSSCRSTTWLSQILSKSVRGRCAIPCSLALGRLLGRRLHRPLRAAMDDRLGRGRLAAALGDARRLAGAAAQVIELGPPHPAAAHHLDGAEARRVKREDALDALAVGDLAQREARIEPGVL